MVNKGLSRRRQRSQRRRLIKNLARRQSHDERLRRWRESFDRRSAANRYIPPEVSSFDAPSDFSLIREPEAVLDHFASIKKKTGPNRIINSDLSNIHEFSTDALVALIALANNPQFTRGAIINGRSPNDPRLADKFRDSGIYGTARIRFADGAIRPAHGTIFRITDTQVLGTVAKNLINFATTRIFGAPQKMKGVYTTMIECMNNTFNHADPIEHEHKVWWATVYCDTERRIAFFNFLDTGVGILESINIKLSESLLRMVGIRNNADLMRDVLEGKIGSRTRLHYRGNGLPEIIKRFKMEQFSRLIIISNNVYADLEKDEYRVLAKPLDGTFFHWEISYDKHYIPGEADD